MPEILPATGGDLHGIDYRVSTVITPGGHEEVTRTETGPLDLIAARLVYWRAQSSINTDIASIRHDETGGGRASITLSFVPSVDTNTQSSDEEYGVQELRAFDIVKDIRLAPYFATLTSAQIDAVYNAWDAHTDPNPDSDWNALQLRLYGHLAHGQESYLETCTEFTKTFRTTAEKILKKSTANPNTVQDLPAISPTMEKLIDAMPSGEWLKKPTQVFYAGAHGWVVTMTYQHAPQWSVVYGGTFTGV